jgi:hypothetical protein
MHEQACEDKAHLILSLSTVVQAKHQIHRGKEMTKQFGKT